ncbi:hypothetical protein [Stenotrophomonas sp. AB1(2024)]|uniref:hypothetical protein n=1 Tax=Stenotrophomonas sp. AB1(2024) TaxID=3132215 RepID=UPI0030AD5595
MSAAVDVLAVMDAAARGLWVEGEPVNPYAADLISARAAVAELIEAADDLVTHAIGCEILLKVHQTETVAKAKAALARVKGGAK